MPGKSSRKWTALELARRIARLSEEKLAERIVLLDVGQAIQVTDYFVIAEGQNRRHLAVVGEHITHELKQDGFFRIGGSPSGDDNWVLLDFGAVVVHVMSAKGRAFYDLENLWGECKRLRWKAAAKRPKDAAPVSGDAAPPA